jgi:hypothetical protein
MQYPSKEMRSHCFVYLNGVPVQPALILNISAMLLACNKKPYLSESPSLYEMVDLGKDGEKKLYKGRFDVEIHSKTRRYE